MPCSALHCIHRSASEPLSAGCACCAGSELSCGFSCSEGGDDDDDELSDDTDYTAANSTAADCCDDSSKQTKSKKKKAGRCVNCTQVAQDL